MCFSVTDNHFQNNSIKLITAIFLFHSAVSVSDLLDYINPDTELRVREIQKKQARSKVLFFFFLNSC